MPLTPSVTLGLIPKEAKNGLSVNELSRPLREYLSVWKIHAKETMDRSLHGIKVTYTHLVVSWAGLETDHSTENASAGRKCQLRHWKGFLNERCQCSSGHLVKWNLDKWLPVNILQFKGWMNDCVSRHESQVKTPPCSSLPCRQRSCCSFLRDVWLQVSQW